MVICITIILCILYTPYQLIIITTFGAGSNCVQRRFRADKRILGMIIFDTRALDCSTEIVYYNQQLPRLEIILAILKSFTSTRKYEYREKKKTLLLYYISMTRRATAATLVRHLIGYRETGWCATRRPSYSAAVQFSEV